MTIIEQPGLFFLSILAVLFLASLLTLVVWPALQLALHFWASYRRFKNRSPGRVRDSSVPPETESENRH